MSAKRERHIGEREKEREQDKRCYILMQVQREKREKDIGERERESKRRDVTF